MFNFLIISLFDKQSPSTFAESFPKEHFDIFKFFIEFDSRKARILTKFLLFKLLPLIFKFDIVLKDDNDLIKYSKPLNSNPQ